MVQGTVWLKNHSDPIQSECAVTVPVPTQLKLMDSSINHCIWHSIVQILYGFYYKLLISFHIAYFIFKGGCFHFQQKI